MKTILCVLSVLVVMIVHPLQAQWIQMGGPTQKWRIQAVMTSGTDVYAAADSSWYGSWIFHSSDNGVSWDHAGLVPGTNSSLAVLANYLFAGTNYGLYRTSNNGQQWTQVIDGEIRSMATMGGDIYATVFRSNDKGIYRSEDSGATWKLLDRYVWKKVVACGTVLFGISDWDSVTRSTDRGEHWTYYNNRVNNLEVVGSVVYTDNEPPLSSSDFGVTWKPVPVRKIFKAAKQGNYLFGLAPYSLFRSSDNGSTWDSVGLKNDWWLPTFEAFAATDSKLFMATYSGLYTSTDAGVTWNVADVASRLADCYTIAAMNGNIFAGTEQGIFRSQNVGATWEPVNTGLTSPYIGNLCLNGTTLFASTYGGLFRSTDFGSTWSPSGAATLGKYVGNIVADGSTLYVPANGLYRSTDNGDQWRKVLPFSIYYIAAANGMVYGTTDTRLYRSSDGGQVWDSVRYVGTYVRSLSAVGDLLFLASDNGFYRSSDKGTTWTPLSGFSQQDYWPAFVSGYNSSLFLAGWNRGFARSEDQGINWSFDNYGFGLDSAKAVAYTGDYLYAGTNSGVWRRPLEQVAMAVRPDRSHDGFEVRSSINPFPSHTTIAFQLEEPALVSLKVFDELGSAVATLASEVLPAGTNEKLFDAGNLPSGIYYYRLQIGERSETGKLVLAR